jgi:hypothetical protein
MAEPCHAFFQTSASTATQSTIATAVGALASDAVMNAYKQKQPMANNIQYPTAASGSVAQQQPAPENPPWDDKDGHYIVQPNTLFGKDDRCESEATGATM